MSKPKLILHIGAAKTGTRSILASLALNEDKLKEKGIFHSQELYDKLMNGIMIKYANSFWVRRNALKYPVEVAFDAYMRRFSDSGFKNMLISSVEMFFYGINGDDTFDRILQHIKRLFSDFDIKIICYLRRQDLYFESYFNSIAKFYTCSQPIFSQPFKKLCAGNVFNLDKYEFEQRAVMTEFDSFFRCYFNMSKYSISISKFAEVFGKENIIIRPFEKGQLHNGVIHDFYSNALDFTDEEISGLKPVQRINESMCRDLLEFKLASGIDDKNIFECVEKLIDNKNNNQRFFDNAERKRFLAFHEKGNSFLAREYLSRRDGRLFYDEVQEYEPYPGLSFEKAQEIRKIMIPLIEYSKKGTVLQIERAADTVEEIVEAARREYFDNVDEKYFKTKMERLFDTLNGSNKTIVIYGVFGKLARLAFDVTDLYQKCVNIYVSDKALHDKDYFNNYIVINLSTLKAVNPDIILITAKYSGKAIKKDLDKLNLTNTVICPAYDFSDKIWKELLPGFAEAENM